MVLGQKIWGAAFPFPPFLYSHPSYSIPLASLSFPALSIEVDQKK